MISGICPGPAELRETRASLLLWIFAQPGLPCKPVLLCFACRAFRRISNCFCHWSSSFKWVPVFIPCLVILHPSILFSHNYQDKPLQNGLTFNHCRLSEVPAWLSAANLSALQLSCTLGYHRVFNLWAQTKTWVFKKRKSVTVSLMSIALMRATSFFWPVTA